MFEIEDDILKLKKQSFIYFISILQEKKELSEEDMSFCKLFNIKYSPKTKKIKTTVKEYTNNLYQSSYALGLRNMLSKISFLKWLDVPSSGEKHTEWDIHFEHYLTFLIEQQDIFKKISNQVEDLDMDVNNIRIEKEIHRNGYVILFDNSKEKTLNFGYSSVGTKKYFTLLTLLAYIEFYDTCKLVLIDEVDSGLNNQVIKSLVKNFSENMQFVITHHRPSLLTNNMNIFDFDEMCFFTYESGKKEIANLTEFENWNKYKRNNKLIFEYIENYFGTEPIL